MAIVVGTVVGAVVWRAAHGNYSDYSDYHSRHSNYREYGDSSLRNQISNKQNEVNRKESDVENLRRRVTDDFNSRINELRREKNYSGFNYPPKFLVMEIKENMRDELDAEIQRDRDELVAIDAMIDKINEIELQAKREVNS